MTNDSKVGRRDFLGAGVKSGAGLAALSGISFFTQPAEGERGQRPRQGGRGGRPRARGFGHIEGFSGCTQR
jgi:hypothetical protein